MSDKYKNGKIYTIRCKNDDSLIIRIDVWMYECMYVCMSVPRQAVHDACG